jgi:hypothetical protein
MMNEELYIKSRMGDKNPFRVPEGYFDNFTAGMMQMLPEQEAPKKSLIVRLRPLMYAAACLLVAIFTVAVYFSEPDTSRQNVASVVEPADTYDVDEAADYMMADNNDIYALLASEY